MLTSEGNPRSLQLPRLQHLESLANEPTRRGQAMLVLTRRVGEEIVIDGTIRVRVVMVRGGITRLGITAPPSVRVARSELLPRCSTGAGSPTSGRPGHYPEEA